MRSLVRGWGVGVLLAVGCGSSLPGNTLSGKDAGATCSGSGQSCAVSGCCGVPSDTCLAQGNDKVCVNAIPPELDGGSDCFLGLTSDLPGVALTFDGAPCA